MARPLDPNAIRRTGKPLHVLLPPDEHAAYSADARARGMTLAEYTREALKRLYRSPRKRSDTLSV